MLTTFALVVLLQTIDADTIRVNLPCSTPLFCKNISVRIKDIDAPEKDCDLKKWQIGKDMLDAFLKKSKKIVLKNCERDKYFRIDCDVWADDVDVSETLLFTGVVNKYGEKHECKKNVPYISPKEDKTEEVCNKKECKH